MSSKLTLAQKMFLLIVLDVEDVPLIVLDVEDVLLIVLDIEDVLLSKAVEDFVTSRLKEFRNCTCVGMLYLK